MHLFIFHYFFIIIIITKLPAKKAFFIHPNLEANIRFLKNELSFYSYLFDSAESHYNESLLSPTTNENFSL